MKIRHKLKSHFYFVQADDSLETARNMMNRHKIRHLPVLNGGGIVGILSDRDLATHGPDSPGIYMPVKNVMTKEVICCAGDTSIRDVCQKMIALKINAIPVTNTEGIMLGIVTSHDLLELLAEWDLSQDKIQPFEIPLETLFAA
jgi:CBS domain-containing protein